MDKNKHINIIKQVDHVRTAWHFYLERTFFSVAFEVVMTM